LAPSFPILAAQFWSLLGGGSHC